MKDLEKRFPTARARKAADEAIDPIPETEPMHVFVDAWLAAYRAAGGIDRNANGVLRRP